MSKQHAVLITPGKKLKQAIEIILPDALIDIIKQKNYTIEIVDLENGIHTVYVCDNNVDVLSVSFDPKSVDNVKYAFKKIYDRLSNTEEAK